MLGSRDSFTRCVSSLPADQTRFTFKNKTRQFTFERNSNSPRRALDCQIGCFSRIYLINYLFTLFYFYYLFIYYILFLLFIYLFIFIYLIYFLFLIFLFQEFFGDPCLAASLMKGKIDCFGTQQSSFLSIFHRIQ